MAKQIVYPFASESTSRAAVPDADPGTGKVSYKIGYTQNYERELGVATDALPVERLEFNEIMHDVTSNIQEWQQQAFPDWQVQDGTILTGYSIRACVRYNDAMYSSLVNNNLAIPTDGLKWELQLSTSQIISKIPMLYLGQLAVATNFNTFLTSCVYTVPTDVIASGCAYCPSSKAGMVSTMAVGAMLIQCYRDTSSTTYVRSYTNSWGSWKQLACTDNVPVTNTSNIIAGTDWDTLLTAGYYSSVSAAGNNAAPFSDSGALEVIGSVGGGAIAQVFWPTTSTSNYVRTAKYTGGTWVFGGWGAFGATAGIVIVPVTSTVMVLTSAQAVATTIKLTGTLTGDTAIVAPTSLTALIENATTSNGYSLLVRTAAGTGIVIPEGESWHGGTDGTNCISGYSHQDLRVRQTVQCGSIDADGKANFIKTGTGLQPQCAGTTDPISMTFAAGFGPRGQLDYQAYWSRDEYWDSVPAGSLSYLTMERNPLTGGVTLDHTLAPVQYSTNGAYKQNSQSILSLNGKANDDFGNTWTPSNITYASATPAIPGTQYAVFNGTTSKVASTSFTTLGHDGWAMRGWFKIASLAAQQALFIAEASGGYGARLQVNTAGKTWLYLSSTGTSHDIANGTLTGAATITIGGWHYYEFTFDPVAGKYYTYVDGVLDQTITSALKVCSFTSMNIGYEATTSYYLNGNAQGFEFLPYCDHPGGVSYNVPTSLPNIAAPGYASDLFDITKMKTYKVTGASTGSGSPPALTPIQRLYAGECTSSTSSAVGSGSLLHFNGTNINDEYGNIWTVSGGAKTQSDVFKFGGKGLGGSGTNNSMNGTSDSIQTSNILSLGDGSWTMRAWVYITNLSSPHGVFCFNNSGGYGASLYISKSGHTVLHLSTNGSSDDINGTEGTISVTPNTWHFIEMTYDFTNSKVLAYIDGVQDQTFNRTAYKVCAGNVLQVGSMTYSAGTFRLAGYLDEFEFKRECDHPNGTTYSVPTVETSNPSNSPAITSVTSYAYNGEYNSGLFAVAVNTTYAKIHNIGVVGGDMLVNLADSINGLNERRCMDSGMLGSSYVGYYPGSINRLSTSLLTCATDVGTYSASIYGQPSGFYRIRVKRSF